VKFGRHPECEHPEPQAVDVEFHLEQDISMVQQATDTYLGDPGEPGRQQLLAALEALDQWTAASDAYEASLADSPVFGFSPKCSVIGETSRNPIAEELPAQVLRAQIALVRAAKAAVTAPGPSSLDALRAANTVLASVQPSPETGA